MLARSALFATIVAAFTITGCAGGGGTGGSAPMPPNPVDHAPSGSAPKTPANLLVYTTAYAAVAAYPASANGNISPSLVLSGPHTQLTGAYAVAFDSHGNMYVTNGTFTATCNASIEVYAPGASGDAAPIRTITGSHTGISTGQGIAIDRFDNLYVVSAGGSVSVPDVAVLEFAPGANGDATPIRKISGPHTGLLGPNGIALDAAGNIYVTNSYNNVNPSSVTEYSSTANGDAAPIATIQGDKTLLGFPPFGIALDAAGNIYVATSDAGSFPLNGYITEYAAGSNGNAAPMATIRGMTTTLYRPEGIALDSSGNIYVSDTGTNGVLASVDVFAASANGDVAPIRTITDSNDPFFLSGNLIALH